MRHPVTATTWSLAAPVVTRDGRLIIGFECGPGPLSPERIARICGSAAFAEHRAIVVDPDAP